MRSDQKSSLSPLFPGLGIRCQSSAYLVVERAVCLLVLVLAPVSFLGQTASSQKAGKPTLAVVDFSVKGEVGIKDAGEAVAELLVTRLGKDRYQLVERTQLAALLREMDLTVALVRDSPERVYGKLRGVKYLVLGSVTKFGDLSITARLVDVATGRVAQTAEISAEDARGLKQALGELAKVLQMTDAEKKAYLDETRYPLLLSRARKMATAGDLAAAIAAYRRVLAIRDTPGVRKELAKVARGHQLQAEREQQKRKREAEHIRRMGQAKLALAGLPRSRAKYTPENIAVLEGAARQIRAALASKPCDSEAMTLKWRIRRLPWSTANQTYSS